MSDLAAARGAADADAARVRDLTRMRLIATGLLVLLALVFVAASLGSARWPALGYLRAFAEAGLVGGCADWFAVTALFRRPLGLPIPHTGIIPRNKARIGQALGGFIADNFLTERVLAEKLRRLEVARWGGDWLVQPANSYALARRLAALLPKLIAWLPPGSVRELVGASALATLRATPAAPLAAKVMKALWRDGRVERLISRAIETLGGYLAAHDDQIRRKVVEHAPKWLPKWVDRIIADKIAQGLSQVLDEMRAPDHPWRQELHVWVEDYIRRLASDPELQARVESFKLRMLADAALQDHATELWSALEASLLTTMVEDQEAVAGRLEHTLRRLGALLAEDDAAQARLNYVARQLVRRVIAPRRHEIGVFVAQIVASWDARSIVDKLELQVGKDLQYIRINGALVGGLVGLALYALSQAFSRF